MSDTRRRTRMYVNTHIHSRTHPNSSLRLLFQYVVFSLLRRILFAGHLRIASIRIGSVSASSEIHPLCSGLKSALVWTRICVEMIYNVHVVIRLKRLLCCNYQDSSRREKLHWIKIYSGRIAASRKVTLKCNACKNMTSQPAVIPRRKLEYYLKKSVHRKNCILNLRICHLSLEYIPLK